MLCYSTGSLPNSCTQSHDSASIADNLAYWLLPTPFRGIEWVIRPEHLARASDASWWLALRIHLEVRGFKVTNVHLGYPRLLSDTPHFPGLSALHPVARSRRLHAALEAARIASWLGCPHLTLTTGLPECQAGLAMAASPDFGLQMQALHHEIARLIAGKPPQVVILIEQEPEMVIHSAEQLFALARAFPGQVYVNYDVGHGAVISEDLGAAVTLLAPYLRNVHLEDIGGHIHRHLLFGEGQIDFTAVFSALEAIGYGGDLTPDLYPYLDHPRLALQASAEFLAQHGYFGL
jgi:sugar phosphate isomerase/epimerase